MDEMVQKLNGYKTVSMKVYEGGLKTASPPNGAGYL